MVEDDKVLRRRRVGGCKNREEEKAEGLLGCG
jgi:hypothetical protein